MKLFVKTLLLCFCAVVLINSCDKGPQGGINGSTGLVLTFDKNVIRSDGNDCVTFRVYNNGVDITNNPAAEVYLVVKGKVPQIVSSGKFSTATEGAYSFQAAYQALLSEEIVINAIDDQIPASVADPEPSNTNFVKRAFFNQHTGTGCGNCPLMTRFLRNLMAVEGAEDKIVLAAVRNYSGEIGFANIPNPAASWPYLQIDYSESFQYDTPVERAMSRVNEITSAPAKVGISANPVYNQAKNRVVINVQVKAAETGEYHLGLWAMQDNYYKTQEDYHNIIGSDESYHNHNNCVRVADSKYMNSHIGYPLGVIEAGSTVTRSFVVNFDTAWWLASEGSVEDMHFAAFVTSPKNSKRGVYYVVENAIDFPYNYPAAFEYR